jgi:RNA polymerase sigma factor (sigma-70 family)
MDDDGALLRRCQAGDHRAWRDLVSRHGGLVYAIARTHRLPEDACDDVAQTVFASLLKHLNDVREPAALVGWLATTARRECWRVVRKSRAQERLARGVASASGEAQEQQPEVSLERVEQAHRVRIALDELGGRCKELLTALFASPDKPDYTLIASRLGMPIGSIGPTRLRCLAKLAEILGPDRDAYVRDA